MQYYKCFMRFVHFYPGYYGLVHFNAFQLPGEHTAQYCCLLGAVDLFVPRASVVPDTVYVADMSSR